MPKFTIIEEPLAEQSATKSSYTKQLDRPYYLDKLREVLQNSRRRNQFTTTNEYKNTIVRHRSQRNQIPPRYETEKSENQQQEVVYVIKEDPIEQREKIRLPKLKRKHRSIKYSDIDQNEKLIIRNYMNAKLIEFKKPKKKKSPKRNPKRNSTIDNVGQLPESNAKRYYVYRKTTPIDQLSSYSNGRQKYRQSFVSSKTQKIQHPIRMQQITYPSQAMIMEERAPSAKMVVSKVIRTEGDEYPVIYKARDRVKSSIMKQYTDQGYKAYPRQYRVSHKAQENGWEFIDPLNLETYFIKLKKMANTSPEQSVLEKTRINIPKIPSREQMSKFIKNYKPDYDQIKIDELIKKDSFQIIQDQIDGNAYFYFGQTKNDVKHGLGVLISERLSFEGSWENDMKTKGVEISEVGKYKGEFKDGKRSGKGQFHWSHGEYYSGEWKNGKKHGSGYWRSQKGESYMGEWKDGQVTGYGVHTMKTGQKYEGQFINFLKHGFGREIFPNEDIYEGRYVQGQPHGKGKYEWKNQTIYEGQFIQGFREGKGTIIAPNRLQFQGLFKHKVISGMGKLRMSNGDVYNGMFQNNKKNGHGILDLKSERRIIKGIWNNNQLVRQQY